MSIRESIGPRSAVALVAIILAVLAVMAVASRGEAQGYNSEERALQIRAIMQHTRDVEGPQVLVGDLNAVPEAPELAPLYERHVDAWPLGGEGPGYTIGAENPNRRIDYVFTTPDVAVRGASVPRTLASDHLPVVADLSVPTAKAQESN